MDTLNFIKDKYNLDYKNKPPFILKGGRREKGLALIFAELGFKVGAEIGVESGKYSKVLCKTIPDLELFCIDSWVSYENYREHVSQEKQDKFYSDAEARLKPYNCTLIKGYSMDVVSDFEDESLDFVYIDGNHEFRQATDDIDEWSRKVRKGGIVAGHDFVRMRGVKGEYIHTKDVVQAWAYAKKINPWFVIKGDRCPSWFWVKE